VSFDLERSFDLEKKGDSQMYRPLIVAAVAAIVAGPAHAHVSFENAQAAVGTTYKAVLRIPHGCDGKATDEVRVPEGVIAVKPMPKAGWTIERR
jgi:periplasmic copper chaperone A